MGGVAIQDGGISALDLTGVIKNDNLSEERKSGSGRVFFGVRGNISSFDFFDGNIFNIESDIVSWDGFSELFVMHFNGFDISGFVWGGEVDGHGGFQDSGFDSSDGDSSDTSNFVDILQWESEGFVDGSFRGDDIIEGFKESGSFVPVHVGGSFDHVISLETRDGDEFNGFDFVSSFFEERWDFSFDFIISVFSVVNSFFVHFVHADDDLFDSEGEGEEGVFFGLSVFGDTSFEFSFGGGNHEDSAIGLGSSGNHIFNEISVSGGINDGDVEFFGFEFPEGDINGDTSFSFGLEFIEHPGVFERSFTHFVGFFFEFFDNSFIDTSTLVDQVSSRGRFSGIDVSDDNDINVSLLFGHFG